MNILAIDLGTKTGWATKQSNSDLIRSGSVNFKTNRIEGAGMRYLRFRRWLDQRLELSEYIDAVYFEEVRRHIGTTAGHTYGGFMATLTSWCEYNHIPYSSVPVGTIKKHATGKGNANKEAMIQAIKAKGYNPIDDNEADALALILYAIETYYTK